MNVVWLSVTEGVNPRGYWDQSLLEFMFKGDDMVHHEKIRPDMKHAIVVIPGAYQEGNVDKVNTELAKLDSCKVIITSDEENKFPIDDLEHPNMRIYATYPNKKYTSQITWLPIGPARINENLIADKPLDWAYLGQVNHESRRKLVEILEDMGDNRMLLETSGFSQGFPRDEYYDWMSRAKVAPAPRGNISPDSFRLYEAMEVGAVPITEDREFWNYLFGDHRFAVIDSDWEEIKSITQHILDYYPFDNNRVQAWWMRKKLDIQDDLLGVHDQVTVVMPTSPIKSHPSTEKIDKVIASVRNQLPGVRIVVTFDGVRPEQEHMRANYEEYIRRFLAKYNNQNVYPIIMEEFSHQVGMAREALKHVATPVILYVEHDIAFWDDPIDWKSCINTITSGELDMLRFHFERAVPKVHQHMMVDKEPIELSVPVIRTFQWSQRPHLASTDFYRRILTDYFTPEAKSFIEDHMHGVVADSYEQTKDWTKFKIGIYNPPGSIERAYHLDGREGEDKYDDRQIF